MVLVVQTIAEAVADPQWQGGAGSGTQARSEGGVCALVVDNVGIVRSCGEAAGRMLGSSFTHIVGKPVSSFLPDFSLSESSSSYSQRYLQHLCNGGGWHVFNAVDAHGHRFVVELSLSPIDTDGQSGYLLNLRRQGDSGCPGTVSERGEAAS